MKFQAINDHRGDYTIELMCKTFDVSKSGYYEWRKTAAKRYERAIREQKLIRTIEAIHIGSKGKYGSPRVSDRLSGLKGLDSFQIREGARDSMDPIKRPRRKPQAFDGHLEQIPARRIDRAKPSEFFPAQTRVHRLPAGPMRETFPLSRSGPLHAPAHPFGGFARDSLRKQFFRAQNRDFHMEIHAIEQGPRYFG